MRWSCGHHAYFGQTGGFPPDYPGFHTQEDNMSTNIDANEHDLFCNHCKINYVEI